MRRLIDSMPRRTVLLALATTAVATAVGGRRAHAVRKQVPPGVPSLNPEDPQAKAMLYVPDVEEVDAKAAGLDVAPIEAGQRCSNCQLYSGTPGTDWGPCAIFSYRTDPKTRLNLVVAADGWCRAWAARAA